MRTLARVGAIAAVVVAVPLAAARCSSSGSAPPGPADSPQGPGDASEPLADSSGAPDGSAGTGTPDASTTTGDSEAATDAGAPATEGGSPATDASPLAGDGGVGWDQVPGILSRIVPPTFPNVDCDVTKYGGVGDGVTDNTTAFAMAIADCSGRGGGRVVAPSGTFFTGPIELQSNINLYVPAGVTIKFSTDPMKYLPLAEVSFEGSRLYNYKPFVSAHDVTNIAITGGGTLDGNATMNDWYSWIALSAADSLALRTQNANGTPVMMRQYGPGHYLRPSLIEFMRCTNILLDGFTAQNSPFWTIHPVMSKNVTGHNVTSIGFVGNTDGFDPESCVDVHLDGLNIMVGDDPIAIKAGRDLDGRTPALYTPTENVVIENCTFGSNNPTHGGSISIGSEMSAGVRNVYAQNITFHAVPGILAQAIYLKASIYRGGFIENFYARQLTVDSIATFFFLNGQYSAGSGGLPPNQPIIFTKFDNINVDGATGKSVTSEAFRIDGPDTSTPATNINISNVTVNQGTAIRTGAAHYKGLTMTNVTVNGAPLNPASTVP
jgi:polygalacturonase